MTKEELKQEAEESLDKMVTDKGIILGCHEGFCYDEVTDFMAEFAEPREKRIADLEDKLANADYQLEGRDNEIRKLEAQIEKMKCCGNCAKYNSGYGENSCKITASGICGEWETSIGKF